MMGMIRGRLLSLLPFLPFCPCFSTCCLLYTAMPSVFCCSTKNQFQVSAPAQSGLILVEDLITSRRPYASKGLHLSFKDRVSMAVGLFSQVLPEEGCASSREDNISLLTDAVGGDGAADEKGDLDGSTGDDEEVQEARALKRQCQWRKWSEDVIPNLLQPYMSLLCETEGLQNINTKQQVNGCAGCSGRRLLEEICVYFESKRIRGYFDLIC